MWDWSSPFGVIVDENIVLHGQLKIGDLFTDPPADGHRTDRESLGVI